jgi:hypothetical protein
MLVFLYSEGYGLVMPPVEGGTAEHDAYLDGKISKLEDIDYVS